MHGVGVAYNKQVFFKILNVVFKNYSFNFECLTLICNKKILRLLSSNYYYFIKFRTFVQMYPCNFDETFTNNMLLIIYTHFL